MHRRSSSATCRRGSDAAYRPELEALAGDLGVAERVTFAGNQPPEGVRDWDRQAAIAVNLSPMGLFDKAALESMAVGVPTMVGSDAFDDLVVDARLKRERPRRPQSARETAERSAGAARKRTTRNRAARLRQRVIEAHSLDHLIGRLVNVLNTGEPA